jgi:hypothetical protein
MLDDAQVERYARHILLPEVGGRGQARLLAARIAVLGDTAVARVARDLVARSGATVSDQAEPSDAIVATGGLAPTAVGNGGRPTVLDRAAAGRARVVLLRGSPCVACVDDDETAGSPLGPAPGAALASVTGAYAVTLALGALLGRPGGSVLHDVDLDWVALGGRPLSGPGCVTCRTTT